MKMVKSLGLLGKDLTLLTRILREIKLMKLTKRAFLIVILLR